MAPALGQSLGHARAVVLQWAAGAYCFIIGTLMLIAPHHFGSRAYGAMYPHLGAWGLGFALAGTLLICVAATAPRRWLGILAHLLAASAFLALAWSLAQVGLWRGTAGYVTMAAGLLIGGSFVGSSREAAGRQRPDLFVLTIASMSGAVGLTFLLLPDQPFLATYGSMTYVYGASLLLAGLALCYTQLIPGAPRGTKVLAHLYAGGAMVAWMLASSWQRQAWTAILMYGGFGILIAGLPWLAPHLRRSSPHSLQRRLGAALAVVAALPVIIVTSLLLSEEERELTHEVQENQQLVAQALAQGVAGLVGSQLEKIGVVASQPDLLTLPPGTVRGRLLALASSSANLGPLRVYDALGNEVTGAGGQLDDQATDAWLEQVRGTGQPGVVVDRSSPGQALVRLIHPVSGPDGLFRGAVVATLEPAQLARVAPDLDDGVLAYVIDGTGQTVAVLGDGASDVPADPSASPLIAAFQAYENGSLLFGSQRSQRIGSYASVAGLDWGVMLEQPQSNVLSDVQRRRDTAFLLVLAGVAAAVTVGVLIARRLAAPLDALAAAAASYSGGNLSVRLPPGTVTEVERLARSFEAMSGRLAERTAELTNERDFSHLLFDSLPGLVFLLSPGSEVVRWNSRVESATGRAPNELHSVSLQALFPHEDHVRIEEAVREAFDTGHAALEVQLNAADRTRTPYRFTAARLLFQGKPHVLLMGIDISARVHAEQEILRLNATLEQRVQERTAELELANEELSAFLYSIAHDLRTPLRSIHGYSRVLQEEAGDRLTPSSILYLQRIQAAATRLGDLLDDLLHVSRLGRSELRRAMIDLSSLAEEVLRARCSLEPKRRIEVQVQSGLSAWADPELLRVVLENLVDNACKFTRHEEHPRIEVGGERVGNETVFYMTDNGVGFDMRYADKLFAVFGRLHRADEFEGNGIGLAIVHRIVLRHGGRVWAESRAGRGATFFFTLGEAPTTIAPRTVPGSRGETAPQ